MLRFRTIAGTVLTGLMILAIAETGAAPAPEAAPTLDQKFPSLSSGALSFASLGDLPPGELLRAGDIRITQKQLAAEIARSPEAQRTTMAKNGLFVVERMATQQLLLALARQEAVKSKDGITTGALEDVVGPYLKSLGAKASVTDQEVADFYENNKELCGGQELEKIKTQLKNYVLKQKQQDVIKEHVRTLGQRTPIVLSSSWVDQQAAAALDNPVDKARKSGLPSLIDFGATGCRPCDMMKPILETLKTKYAGRANVVFVHVREDQFLAARYGIKVIPIQAFFDKDGKEVFRHTGFYPQADIEKKLAEMGVN